MRTIENMEIKVIKNTNAKAIDLRSDCLFTTTVLVPGIGSTQTGISRKMNSMIDHCKWK